MDEPFGAVDPIVRERLQDELLRLQERLRKTIVFVTHDIDEAIKLGDRVVVLNVGGVLEQVARADELLAHPANEFVARFVGGQRGVRRLLALIKVSRHRSRAVRRRRRPRSSRRDATLLDALQTILRAGVELRAASRARARCLTLERIATRERRRERERAVRPLGLGRVPPRRHLGADARAPPAHRRSPSASGSSSRWRCRSSRSGSGARTRRSRGSPGILYTIPSIALFALLVPVTGLTITTAEVGLVSYTLLILVRNIVAGIDGVPAAVREAAVAMGYRRWRMFAQIELPLALPVIIAGLRIATVTTVGLVTVTALIGQGGYGAFINDGLQRFFNTPLVVGAVLSVALAVALDVAARRRRARAHAVGAEARPSDGLPRATSSGGSPTPRTGRARTASRIASLEHVQLSALAVVVRRARSRSRPGSSSDTSAAAACSR